MNPLFRIDFSISDSLKIVRKSVLIYETIIIMAIEIKINKEIHQYKESMFFGLTLRQFTCSALAVGIAVAAYFYFRPLLGDEAVSWICIFGACPMAVAGFFHYNGMTLEKTLWAIFKSQVLLAGKRVWKAENYYWKAIQMEEGRNKKKT